MTVHRLHAGDGYTYLTRQTATADRERETGEKMVDYYTAEGCPAGTWWGAGAEAMGMSGEVTEAHMLALFGEGLHPEADAIIAREIEAGKTVDEAIKAAKLGRAFPQFGAKDTPIAARLQAKTRAFVEENKRLPTQVERAVLRTDAAREHLRERDGGAPSRAAVEEALAQEKRGSRSAVAGFDCVFTPAKSISLLWAFGSPEVAAMVERWHEEAVTEVLEWMQTECAKARRGKGSVRQIDAVGLSVVRFDHRDNRAGDPNLHTHAGVSGKVLGVDGTWSSLDARSLYKFGVPLSTHYNAAIVDKARRAGYQLEATDRGPGKEPVFEIAGIPAEMIAAFSRRPNIVARTRELAAEYRAKHGRDADKKTQYKLAQQATLETRVGKAPPTSLSQLRGEWAERIGRFLGDGRTGEQFINELREQHLNPAAPRPFDPREVAVAVGVQMGVAALADPHALTTVLTEHLDRCVFDAPQARIDGEGRVRELLADHTPGGFIDTVKKAIAEQEKSVYDPDRIAGEILDTVEARRATWGPTHLRSAAAAAVSYCTFDSDQARRDAIDEVTGAAQNRSVLLSVEADEVPDALRRGDGHSVYTVHGSELTYTSEKVLAREDRLLAAAHTPTTEFLPGDHVAAAIAAVEKDTGRELNAGQRAITAHLCGSGQLLAVAVGPAGTGKTTAMRAVCQAWQTDGRDVLALAPSAAAARVLGDELGVRGRTLASVLTAARIGADTGITTGAMLLVDEAGMAATADLDALVGLARDAGAVVRWVGDPHQLAAVDSGGALRLLARSTAAPELSHVVRFGDDDEADASLAVRSGDADKAWEFYDTHARIRSGLDDTMREQVLTDHLADLEAGVSSVMLAATTGDVRELNQAAQAAHAVAGKITTDGRSVALADESTGYVGDQIVTRKNHSRLRITGGKRRGTGIDNGDLWTIAKIHRDGSITAKGKDHRGRVHLPADYVRENVELGYAATIHRAQGITVRRSRVLMNTTLGRSLAYVGLTRGADTNVMYLATDTLPGPDTELPPGSEEPLTAREVFGRVLAREDDNLTATETLRAELDRVDNPDRLRAIHADLHAELAAARATYLLERALPAALAQTVAASAHETDLHATLAAAETAGLDTAAMVTAICQHDTDHVPGESLLDARDPGAVLRARADAWIETALAAGNRKVPEGADGGEAPRFRALRDLTPVDLPAAPARFPGMDTELADYADHLADRIRRLERDAATTPAAGFAVDDRARFLRAVHTDPVLADALEHAAAQLRVDGIDPDTWCDDPAGLLTGDGGRWAAPLARAHAAQTAETAAAQALAAADLAYTDAMRAYADHILTDPEDRAGRRQAMHAAGAERHHAHEVLGLAQAETAAAARDLTDLTRQTAAASGGGVTTLTTAAEQETEAVTLADLVPVYRHGLDLITQARIARQAAAHLPAALAATAAAEPAWPQLRDTLAAADRQGMDIGAALNTALDRGDLADAHSISAVLAHRVREQIDRDTAAARIAAMPYKATMPDRLGDAGRHLLADPDQWGKFALALREVDRAGTDVEHALNVLAVHTRAHQLDADQVIDAAHALAAHPAGATTTSPAWITEPPAPADGDDPYLTEWARRQYMQITDRTRDLAAAALDERPDWLEHLGPRPGGPASAHLWDVTVTQAAAYRDEYEITDQTSLIGQRPGHSDVDPAWNQITGTADQLTAPTSARHDTGSEGNEDTPVLGTGRTPDPDTAPTVAESSPSRHDADQHGDDNARRVAERQRAIDEHHRRDQHRSPDRGPDLGW